jgi:aspartate/methionine/tyrosine aminotransferase
MSEQSKAKLWSSRGCSSYNASSEEAVEPAVFDDSQIDLDQLRRKAYNYRWATVPDDVIPLTAADSDFPVARPIREAMAKYINEGYMNYTPPMGLPSLREAIVNHRRLQSMNQVFVTDSAASAMFLVAQYCLRHPGDEVLCPDPVDFLFQRSIEQAGGKVVRYALSAPSQSNGSLWKLDADVISSLITHRTKMIAICNPHNPVGRVWTVAEIRQLCDIAKRNHLLLWSDEVWADITYTPFTPTAEISRQYDIDTFTVIGFSKGYGLAGLRIGAILCPTSADAEAISKLSLANDTAYGTASVSQVAAQAALERCSHWLREFRAHVESQCKYAVQRLNQIPHVYCTMPEGTFVCFANVSYYLEKKGIDEATLVEYLINHAKVAVVPGSPQFFGHNAAGHIRISVATSRPLLKNLWIDWKRGC